MRVRAGRTASARLNQIAVAAAGLTIKQNTLGTT